MKKPPIADPYRLVGEAVMQRLLASGVVYLQMTRCGPVDEAGEPMHAVPGVFGRVLVLLAGQAAVDLAVGTTGDRGNQRTQRRIARLLRPISPDPEELAHGIARLTAKVERLVLAYWPAIVWAVAQCNDTPDLSAIDVAHRVDHALQQLRWGQVVSLAAAAVAYAVMGMTVDEVSRDQDDDAVLWGATGRIAYAYHGPDHAALDAVLGEREHVVQEPDFQHSLQKHFEKVFAVVRQYDRSQSTLADVITASQPLAQALDFVTGPMPKGVRESARALAATRATAICAGELAARAATGLELPNRTGRVALVRLLVDTTDTVAEAMAIFADAERSPAALIELYRPAITAVAKRLDGVGSLSGDALRDLLQCFSMTGDVLAA